MLTCDKCLWHEQCASYNVCDYFTPIDEDEYIDEKIEEGRREFYEEWFGYMDHEST